MGVSYLLLSGINDTLSDMEILAKKLSHLRNYITLVLSTYNNIPRSSFSSPLEKKITSYCELLSSRGYSVEIFNSLAGNIGSACGQMRSYDVSRYYQ